MRLASELKHTYTGSAIVTLGMIVDNSIVIIDAYLEKMAKEYLAGMQP